MSDTNTGDTFTYGDFTIDVSTLPAASVRALISRGINHLLGNEQSSKVVTRSKAYAAEHNGEQPSEELTSAWKADLMAGAVEALRAGTVGANSRGPRGTALETIMRRIAEDQVRGALKKQGKTMPKGKDEKVSLPRADGTTGQFTRNELIQIRLNSAKFGPAIRKEAERQVATLAKAGDLFDE